MSSSAADTPPEPDRPSLLDLALNQGRRPELDALRAEVLREPGAAIEYAELRQLIERMRGAVVEPSDAFAARLAQCVATGAARRQQRQRQPVVWTKLLLGAAAAAVLFVGLAWLDPLHLRRHERAAGFLAACELQSPATAPRRPDPPAPVVPSLPSRLARAIDAAERMASDTHLLAALGRFQQLDATDRLQPWLSPRNALAELVLAQERRAQSTAGQVRDDVPVGDQELTVAVASRLSALANDLGAALRGAEPLAIVDTAAIVRALLAVDHRAAADLRAGGDHLAAALPDLEGGALAVALDALAALTATTGEHTAVVADAGRRLVHEVLDVKGETWVRRRPRLLVETTSVAELTAAGRFLRIAPEFGVEADEAMLVRLLLAAHLRERRAAGNDGPELPIALLHGYGDLLGENERGELEVRRRQWRSTALAPDFLLLHDLATTYCDGHPGSSRFSLELRGIACMPTPMLLRDRAGLCLCLADHLATRRRGIAVDG